MNKLVNAFTNLEPEILCQMAKSYCASKISNIIVNSKPLKTKIKDLEELKQLELVQALPEETKQEVINMFDTAIKASKEISRIKKKF